jgi:glucose-6-phosphate 1-epimerase
MTIDALNAEYGIPGAVEIVPGCGGLPKVVLTHPSGSTAAVYLHGAHVASWQVGGRELFFVSRASHFEDGKPIRGGIPVIFPQFGGGVLPQHGLARTRAWELVGSTRTGVTLQLTDSDETRAVWPHPFRVTLTVTLEEASLTVALDVVNPGAAPFDYQAALHTYFQVADIRATAVHGLRGTVFIDSLRDDARDVETRDAIRFAEETDRIYVDAPDRLRIDDEGRRLAVAIAKSGMPDVVVWNPWIAKAQRMADFGDEEYASMVCVETGIIAETRPLAAGDAWHGETVFTCA